MRHSGTPQPEASADGPDRAPRRIGTALLLVALMLPWSAWCSGAPSLAERIARERVIPVAHRGVTERRSVENSLLGMQAALLDGITFFELDIRESGAGDLLLLHDATLDRTTGGSGALAEATADDLSRIRLKGSGEVLPTFAALLGFARERPVYLMLDVKDADVHKVLERTRAAGLEPRTVLLTFDRETAERAMAAPGRCLISVLVKDEDDLGWYLDLFQRRQFLAYLPSHAPLSLFEAASAEGVPVVSDVMGPVDEDARRDGGASYRDFLARREVALLVTDYPELIRRSLRPGPDETAYPSHPPQARP